MANTRSTDTTVPMGLLAAQWQVTCDESHAGKMDALGDNLDHNHDHLRHIHEAKLKLQRAIQKALKDGSVDLTAEKFFSKEDLEKFDKIIDHIIEQKGDISAAEKRKMKLELDVFSSSINMEAATEADLQEMITKSDILELHNNRLTTQLQREIEEDATNYQHTTMASMIGFRANDSKTAVNWMGK